MTVIFFNFFTFLLLIFFNGKIFMDFFFKNLKDINCFECSIMGLVVTGFVAQIINFFYPLNNFIIYLNIFFIVIYIFLDFKKIKYLKPLISFSSILIFLLVLANIYGSSFSDDLNHYHHGSIVNTDKGNYIIGSNSLHNLYGFSSIWLILHSYLNFDYSRLQDIHIVNGIILYLFLSFLLFEVIKEIRDKKNTVYLPLLLFCLIFILTKYTRIKEFGIDRSAFIIFFYIMLFYIKHNLLNLKNVLSDQFRISIFLLLLFLCTFLFFIKIIFVFSFILPITIFFLIKKKSLIFKDPLIYILSIIYISYFIKNLLISGCLIYPIEQICFSELSWYNEPTIKSLNLNAEVFNKSFFQYTGDLSKAEYIKKFYWLPTWINRNIRELFEFFALLTLIFLIVILNFNKSKKVYSNNKIRLFGLISVFLFSLTLIFLKTPVIRMSHHVFVLMFFIIFLKYFGNHVIINKKIIIIIILIAFTFNISKNLIRIKKSNFVNNPIFLLKKSGLYSKARIKKIGDFVYYQGWIGGYPIGRSKLENYNHKKWFIFDIISKIN